MFVAIYVLLVVASKTMRHKICSSKRTKVLQVLFQTSKKKTYQLYRSIPKKSPKPTFLGFSLGFSMIKLIIHPHPHFPHPSGSRPNPRRDDTRHRRPQPLGGFAELRVVAPGAGQLAGAFGEKREPLVEAPVVESFEKRKPLVEAVGSFGSFGSFESFGS